MDLNGYHVLNLVRDERLAQDMRWGQQNHPNGTASYFSALADSWRNAADEAAENGELTWTQILSEEFYEALAEEDPIKLRGELIQVAAVAVAWIEAIDRAHAK